MTWSGWHMKRPEIIEAIRETLKRVAPNAQAILYGSEAVSYTHLNICSRGGYSTVTNIPCKSLWEVWKAAIGWEAIRLSLIHI